MRALTLKKFPENSQSVLDKVELKDFDLATANAALFAQRAAELRKEFATQKIETDVFVDFDPTIFGACVAVNNLEKVIGAIEKLKKHRWRYIKSFRQMTNMI